jgi:uncharacterized membrane protein
VNVFLWIVAILLAAAFAGAGVMHAFQSKEKLDKALGWTEDFSATQVKGIGVVELLGAVGLILPAATDIATVLTPLAATGLGLLMLGAMATHVRRKEPQGVAVNLVLLALAVVVAWGRFGPHSF